MANINSFYREHAMEYAVISEDGLTVTLPSEKEFANSLAKKRLFT